MLVRELGKKNVVRNTEQERISEPAENRRERDSLGLNPIPETAKYTNLNKLNLSNFLSFFGKKCSGQNVTSLPQKIALMLRKIYNPNKKKSSLIPFDPKYLLQVECTSWPRKFL